MQLEKLKNAKRGAFWGILNKLVAILFPFFIRTIIINKLGAEYSGLNSLFTSVLQVLSLADLGFSSAMVFAMYEPIANDNIDELNALLNYFRKIYLIIGLVILVIGCALIPFLNFFISGDVPESINIYILYVIFLMNSVLGYVFLSYRASLFSSYQREDVISIFNLVANIAMYSLQILVLLLIANYYAYIILLPVFTIFGNLLKYIYSKKMYSNIKCIGVIDKNTKKKISKKISALFCHKFGGTVVNTADNIVISAFLGLVVLSNYNNYYYLISAVSSIILILFNAFTAGIGNNIILKSKEDNMQKFYAIFFANCIIVMVCTVCLFSMLQDFIVVWVGEQYMFDSLTMILLCVYFFVHTIRRTIIMFRDAAGMWNENKFQPIVSAVFNLIINIILIQYIGVNGVIISTILSMLLIDIPWESITFFKSMFSTKCFRYILYMLFFSLLTVGSCFIMYLINQYLEINIYVQLIVNFLLSVSIASVIICSTCWHFKEFKYLVCRIFKRKRQKTDS